MKKWKKYVADIREWLKETSQLIPGKFRESEMLYCNERIHVLLDKIEAGQATEAELVMLNDELRLFADQCTNELNREQMSVPIGKHQLPPLGYPYNALEPAISEETMRLHHDKHHQAYVDGLNKAELMMEKARKTNDYSLIKHWEREAAFHGSGHYLHTLFWESMKPRGGGKPTGKLLAQIEKDFGSFNAFKKHFSEAAKQVEGVGWAILVWSPRAHRLEILQTERHMILTQWDTIPLLALDVWEHAYYLQYKNKKDAYVDNWWNVVNWNNVSERFEKAKTLKWKPY